MPQTSVNPAGQPQAVAGQVSQAMEGMDIVSRFNAETVTCLAFGTGVKNGTNDHECKILTANSETVQGVVKWGNNHTPGATGDVDQTATPPGLKPAAGFGLVRKGRVWVAVDAGVTSIAANVIARTAAARATAATPRSATSRTRATRPTASTSARRRCSSRACATAPTA